MIAILAKETKLGKTAFNYFVRDICILFLKWSVSLSIIYYPCFSLTSPTRRDFVPAEDADVASDFLVFLMKNSIYPSSLILRSNVQIIKLLLEHWRNAITIPKVRVGVLVFNSKCITMDFPVT